MRLEDKENKNEQNMNAAGQYDKLLKTRSLLLSGEINKDSADKLIKDLLVLEAESSDPVDRGKAALTELFENVRNKHTPVIVERIVSDIDGIVRMVRFPGWQDTPTGRREVSRNLRDVIMRRYQIKDTDVFNRAYSYVEQYY